jgi:chromosome segregation protein
MHLKSLEIQGFKSFANKSIYEFDKGVTAIVGPNGSGKSNIADAIRWVLGEQSYTNLRAQKTSDMIFSGSSNRARQGMAYVSIVLDNSDGTLPLDYNEVTIARRAFRSGENEYLINNNRVRLKDVAEILARGGLARQTYTLVGQGTIDRALSLRSGERRQLFEEAAGIIYHRQRRAETLRRLDDTRQNLLRVHDILSEIEPRLKRLGRQVQRVEEHQKIRRHLDGLLKVWYGYQWGQGQQRLHHSRVRDTIGQQRLLEEQENLQQVEDQIEALRRHQTEIRGQLGDWHAESSRLHGQAEALQRELAVGEERARQLAAQREEFLTEIAILEETQSERQKQLHEAQDGLAAINEALHQARSALHDAEQNLAQHESKRAILQRQQRQADEAARHAAHQQTDRQSRLAQLAERFADLQTQQETQSQALEQLHAQQIDLAQKTGALQETLNKLEAVRDDLKEKNAARQETRQALLQKAGQLTAGLSAIEKQLASLQARLDLLERLRSDMSGYYAGVKEVLQTESLTGIVGTVAQLIEVPEHLEAAIEAAIGGRLQEIVVNHRSDADAAIAHLKKVRAGRATFLPLDSLRPPDPLGPPKTTGVIGLAADLVRFDSNNEPAISSLLNRLLVVEDLASARAAFDALSGSFQIATLAGEIIRSGGSISGGMGKDGGSSRFLSREREWRELPEEIANLEEQLRQTQTEITQNAAMLAELEQQIIDLQQQEVTLSEEIQQRQYEARAVLSKEAEIKSQIVWQQELQTKIRQDTKANQAQQEQYRADIVDFAQQQTKAETQAETLRQELTTLSAEALQTELNQARSQVAIEQERHRSQKTLLNNFTEALNHTQSQLGQRQARVQSLEAQRSTLLNRLSGQQDIHKQLMGEVKQVTDKIEPAEAELREYETSRIGLEDEENKMRHHLRRLEAEASRLALELARQQDKMHELQRQIEDDFGLVQFQLSEDQVGQPVLPLESLVTQLPTIETLPEVIEEDIRHLKVQLRQLGHINPDAPKEYDELKTRFEFLSGQMADLEDAAQDLRAVIGELDKIMEEAFTETYENVAKAFQQYFRLLFNGGEAQLILTEPENIAETGIDIVARPPGKRLQNLELLSGGERSLTAQALIFALLRTSPTPYVIFDEVDAMLDEVNVDRFRQALLALSKDIQFIIITHNRKTIEVAKTIYGIFMREDGISERVSLKLDEVVSNENEQLTFDFQQGLKRPA